MKYKFLVPIILSILLGLILGKIFFTEYDLKTKNVFKEGERTYFIKVDQNKTKENLLKKYDEDSYLYLLMEDGYHIYSGITKDEKIAQKIQDYYQKNGNNSNIEEKTIDNQTFLSVLGEYDKVAKIATSDKDLIQIEKIVLSNYKEMTENQDDENKGNAS